MNRINPRVLGILTIVIGVCAALPFQKRASHRTPVQPRANSEDIQWRSHDFTLAVKANDQASADSPYADDRPKSPAFGGANGTTVNSRASLDHITPPPSLAGAYQAPAADALIANPRRGTEQPRSPGATDQVEPSATNASIQSVAITHEIVNGDTLEALAEKHLGSRLRWTEIYNANPEILDDPQVLPQGVTIVILPGLRPSEPVHAADPEQLVPVPTSDLLKFRRVNP